MAWHVTYFDQIILSMSSLQTTYHNIRAANGIRSPPLELHEVLEKVLESNPKVKPMHKAIRQYMHMVGRTSDSIYDGSNLDLSIDKMVGA